MPRRVSFVIVAAAAALSLAARRDYVGSEACGGCHPAELAAWRATAHARADRPAPITAAGCRACHATGDAPLGPAYFPAVGCEACHGAGAAYAEDDLMRDLPLARLLGLVDLRDPVVRARQCARCHGAASTRLAPLDLAAPAHPRRP